MSAADAEPFECVLCPLVTPSTDGCADETTLVALIKRLEVPDMDGPRPSCDSPLAD